MNLTKQQIHLWYISLNTTESLNSLFSILSIDEQQKANDFYSNKHRTSYILRKSALRQILSQYCMTNPNAINFKYTYYQKPYFKINPFNLQFNMSHSYNMAILAITKKHSIGIDLECIQPMENVIDIANQFFSPQEYSKFVLVPSSQKIKTFYTIWTRKEAFVKAIGEGLYYPLNAFEVTFLPTEPIKILKINNSTAEAAKWSLNSSTFNYANNQYISAIITKSYSKKIVSFHYPNNLQVNLAFGSN